MVRQNNQRLGSYCEYDWERKMVDLVLCLPFRSNKGQKLRINKCLRTQHCEQTMFFVRKGYRFRHTGWRIRSRRRFPCGSHWYVAPPKRVCFFFLHFHSLLSVNNHNFLQSIIIFLHINYIITNFFAIINLIFYFMMCVMYIETLHLPTDPSPR